MQPRIDGWRQISRGFEQNTEKIVRISHNIKSTATISATFFYHLLVLVFFPSQVSL